MVKWKRISQIIHPGKSGIFLVQESKFCVVDSKIISCFWSKEKLGWSYASAIGRSGGFITIWKEGCSEVIFNFKGTCILRIKLK